MSQENPVSKYYLLARDLQEAATALAPSDVPTAAELDEIDQIRKVVLEVSSEKPRSYTTT